MVRLAGIQLSCSEEKERNLEKAVTAKDQRITDIYLKAGAKITFDSSGCLNEVLLSSDQTVQGVCYPGIFFKAGTIVHLGKYGLIKFAKLSADQILNGIPCKGETMVYFFENGRIQSATLSESVTLAGLNDKEYSFKAGTEVRFYKDGKVFGA